jgi:hypothetical protein
MPAVLADGRWVVLIYCSAAAELEDNTARQCSSTRPNLLPAILNELFSLQKLKKLIYDPSFERVHSCGESSVGAWLSVSGVALLLCGLLQPLL